MSIANLSSDQISNIYNFIAAVVYSNLSYPLKARVIATEAANSGISEAQIAAITGFSLEHVQQYLSVAAGQPAITVAEALAENERQATIAAEQERQRQAALAAAEQERQRQAALAAAEQERQRQAAIAAAEQERQRQAAAAGGFNLQDAQNYLAQAAPSTPGGAAGGGAGTALLLVVAALLFM